MMKSSASSMSSATSKDVSEGDLMNLAADLVDFDFSGSTDSADLQEDTESISSLTDGDSSPSHSISSVSGKPKRRRKPANPYCANGERASMYILKPRVFKNDLRRYFMNMYTNVFNAFDADFLRSYASTIFHPKMEYLCSNVDFVSKEKALVFSADTAVKYSDAWAGHVAAGGSDTMTIVSAAITLRSDGTAVVSAKVVMHGTRLADKDAPTEASDVAVTAAGDIHTSTVIVPEGSYIAFVYDADFRMHVDKNKFITQLEFDVNCNKPVEQLYK